MSTSVYKRLLTDETAAAKLDAQNAILARIADKMGAYEEPLTWAALQAQVRAGNAGLFVQPGDQVTVDMAETLSVTVAGEGISAASVTDKDTFLDAAGTRAHDYEFTYDGAAWHFNGAAVTLADYGISATGTAADGDTIAVHRSATAYDFDVLGIDEDESVNAGYPHVLTIQMHDVFSEMIFDPPQYLFAVTAEACEHFGWPTTGADAGMPAGTYNVTLAYGSWGSRNTGEDGTYQFTTTQIVPIGGGIRHSTMGSHNSGIYVKANITGGKFITYAADRVTVLENNLVTSEAPEGDSHTNLGTTTGDNPQYKVGDYINTTERQRYGGNRWSTSFLRQYLNSDEATMTFRPATIWSRRPDALPEGFLHALDPELRAVLCAVRTKYAKSLIDGLQSENVADVVKIGTILDVLGRNNTGDYPTITEGPVDSAGTVTRTKAYSYWAEMNTDADRVKYLGGTAKPWFTSSPNAATGFYVHRVGPSGAYDGYNALENTLGLAPILHIG